MRILVNGSPREVLSPCSLAVLVERREGVAAAVNGEVVRSSDWDATLLRDGDEVELLTAFQGG